MHLHALFPFYFFTAKFHATTIIIFSTIGTKAYENTHLHLESIKLRVINFRIDKGRIRRDDLDVLAIMTWLNRKCFPIVLSCSFCNRLKHSVFHFTESSLAHIYAEAQRSRHCNANWESIVNHHPTTYITMKTGFSMFLYLHLISHFVFRFFPRSDLIYAVWSSNKM